MKKKIQYSEGPIKDIKRVKDFLPAPEQLAMKEESVKITISLSKSTVEFFKEEAKSHHTQYQKMIRRLLDEYSILYS
jgi:predicted DNA binding CopG/RHH family protein